MDLRRMVIEQVSSFLYDIVQIARVYDRCISYTPTLTRTESCCWCVIVPVFNNSSVLLYYLYITI